MTTPAQNPHLMPTPQMARPQSSKRLAPKRRRKWILWSVMILALFTSGGFFGWRWYDQKQNSGKEAQVTELLDSADALIASNQQDAAATKVQQALRIFPENGRSKNIQDRIAAMQGLVVQQTSSAAHAALDAAELLTRTDLSAAIKAFNAVAQHSEYPADVKQKATARVNALQGGVCSLHLPDDWPADANIYIDDVYQQSKNRLITGITQGKHKLRLERYRYRNPALVELDFQNLTPIQLPSVQWRLWGTSVTIHSSPAGAQVWKNGKNTGKTTPVKLDDVDDGEVLLVLKMAGHADTPVRGEVKDRKPLALNATLLEMPKLPSEGKSPGERREFNLTKSLRVPFRWCPAGTFKMGGMAETEKPQRNVTLTKGFWLAETEFTQKQWLEIVDEYAESQFMVEGKGKAKPTIGPDAPMVYVSWEKICGDSSRKGGVLGIINAWLSLNKNPWLADLPTEAQWEYACAAGGKGDVGSASADPKTVNLQGWYTTNSNGQAHEVATKGANAWGLHDMQGNVYEWCRDWYEPNYKNLPSTDPTGPKFGEWKKAIRGGCFSSAVIACKATSRNGADRYKGMSVIGFRLALHLPEAAPAPSVPAKKVPSKPKPKPKPNPKPKPVKPKGK